MNHASNNESDGPMMLQGVKLHLKSCEAFLAITQTMNTDMSLFAR
jgi:hypothetical protein